MTGSKDRANQSRDRRVSLVSAAKNIFVNHETSSHVSLSLYKLRYIVYTYWNDGVNLSGVFHEWRLSSRIFSIILLLYHQVHRKSFNALKMIIFIIKLGFLKWRFSVLDNFSSIVASLRHGARSNSVLLRISAIAKRMDWMWKYIRVSDARVRDYGERIVRH